MLTASSQYKLEKIGFTPYFDTVIFYWSLFQNHKFKIEQTVSRNRFLFLKIPQLTVLKVGQHDHGIKKRIFGLGHIPD